MCQEYSVSNAIQIRCGTLSIVYKKVDRWYGKCYDLKHHRMLWGRIEQAAMLITCSHTLPLTIFISVSWKYTAAEMMVMSVLLSAR